MKFRDQARLGLALYDFEPQIMLSVCFLKYVRLSLFNTKVTIK